MNPRIFIVIAIALMFVTGVGAVTTAASAQSQDSIMPNQTELSKCDNQNCRGREHPDDPKR